MIRHFCISRAQSIELTSGRQSKESSWNHMFVFSQIPGINEDTGICETGQAFATCAGFLAFALLQATQKN